MRKILFYNDVCGFGGHEIMTLEAVNYLVNKTDLKVCFMFYEGNERLLRHMTRIRKDNKNLELYPIKYASSILQSLKTMLSPVKLLHLRGFIADIHPDVVVVAQGNIEVCSLGIVASKWGSFRTVSYIPLAHSLAFVGSKWGRARDFLNRYFYSLPDLFITVSKSMKTRIAEHGVSQEKISVVYNGINLNNFKIRERKEMRSQYGIGEGDYAVALIGRIHFMQKGHDFLLKAMAWGKQRLVGDIKLFIVGEGPDMECLRDIIRRAGLEDAVRVIPWSDDLSYVYSAIDALIIPSRFEGMPMVMLEAMYYGLPVIASDVDGMSEMLPNEWLFKYGDGEQLIERILHIKKSDNSHLLRQNKEVIADKFNHDTFGKEFYQALMPEKAYLPSSVSKNRSNRKI